MRRRDPGPELPPAPLPSRTGRPPSNWARVDVEGEDLVIRLVGWRKVLAVSRGLRLPIGAIVGVRREPLVHATISTKLRKGARGRTRLWRLGPYHGTDGWSYWACGLGRNAVVIEATGIRYRYVVVEAEHPDVLLTLVRRTAGLSGVPAGPAPVVATNGLPELAPDPGRASGSEQSPHPDPPSGERAGPLGEGAGPLGEPTLPNGKRGGPAENGSSGSSGGGR